MTDRAHGLVVDRDDAVTILRLDRPEAANALDSGLLRSLSEALAHAEADAAVRAIVLIGTGDRSFCAGLDLRELASDAAMTNKVPPEAMATFMRLLGGEVVTPLIGAANASALAGGLEILLGCDLVVASSAARFGLPEVRRGLFPGGNGTTIGRRIPLGVALEMTMTGRPVDAARAYELGLVNAVVEPDRVLDAALDLARAIAANAPLGVAAVKELVRMDSTGDPARADRLAYWQQVVFGSEDAAEGATAFVERRDPVWRGR